MLNCDLKGLHCHEPWLSYGRLWQLEVPRAGQAWRRVFNRHFQALPLCAPNRTQKGKSCIVPAQTTFLVHSGLFSEFYTILCSRRGDKFVFRPFCLLTIIYAEFYHRYISRQFCAIYNQNATLNVSHGPQASRVSNSKPVRRNLAATDWIQLDLNSIGADISAILITIGGAYCLKSPRRCYFTSAPGPKKTVPAMFTFLTLVASFILSVLIGQ